MLMSRFGTVGYKEKKVMSGYDNVHLEYIPLEHFVFLIFHFSFPPDWVLFYFASLVRFIHIAHLTM